MALRLAHFAENIGGREKASVCHGVVVGAKCDQIFKFIAASAGHRDDVVTVNDEVKRTDYAPPPVAVFGPVLSRLPEDHSLSARSASRGLADDPAFSGAVIAPYWYISGAGEGRRARQARSNFRGGTVNVKASGPICVPTGLAAVQAPTGGSGHVRSPLVGRPAVLADERNPRLPPSHPRIVAGNKLADRAGLLDARPGTAAARAER